MTLVAAPIPKELPAPTVAVIAVMSLVLLASTSTVPGAVIVLLRTVAATLLLSSTTFTPAPMAPPWSASAPAPVVGLMVIVSVAVTDAPSAPCVTVAWSTLASVVLLTTVKTAMPAIASEPPSAPPIA